MGVHKKGGSREPLEPPLATGLVLPMIGQTSRNAHVISGNPLREFTASCKVVPLDRATFWMLKLVNFHRCPCCPCDIMVP